MEENSNFMTQFQKDSKLVKIKPKDKIRFICLKDKCARNCCAYLSPNNIFDSIFLQEERGDGESEASWAGEREARSNPGREEAEEEEDEDDKG